MKSIVLIAFLALTLSTAKAQQAHLPFVTKISTATATVNGSTVTRIIYEDTVTSRPIKYLPYRLGETFTTYTGTGTATRLNIIDKSGRLVYSGRVAPIRVVGSSDTTSAQKVIYLKANTY